MDNKGYMTDYGRTNSTSYVITLKPIEEKYKSDYSASSTWINSVNSVNQKVSDLPT